MTAPILTRLGYLALAALATWLLFDGVARLAGLSPDLPPMPGRPW